MKRKTIIWSYLGVFLVAVLPIILALIGLLLNTVFGCGIQDEGGTMTGTCAEGIADIVYTLMMMPWLLFYSVPFALLLFVLFTLGLIVGWMVKRKK